MQSSIFEKTEKARQALGAGQRLLTPRFRALLLLMDGRRSLADIELLLGAVASHHLAWLLMQGYAKVAKAQPAGESEVRYWRELPEFERYRRLKVARDLLQKAASLVMRAKGRSVEVGVPTQPSRQDGGLNDPRWLDGELLELSRVSLGTGVQEQVAQLARHLRRALRYGVSNTLQGVLA